MAAVDGATPVSYDRARAVKEFDESKMGVKGLSESGITSIPRFFIHPPETLSDLSASSHSSSLGAIPVIDLSGLDSVTDRPELVQQVREAARTWGFFQVVNHGVPVSALEETINAIRAFHEQPYEAKAKYYKREEGRGVMFASNNDLYRTEVASWHDSLQAWMTPEPPAPEELPEVCRREVIAWDRYAKLVADKVMELLSEGLGLEPGTFRDLTFADSRALVGHCYPYCPQPELTLGIKSHTDPGIITVLLQNRVPGLQVKHGDRWIDVDPVPGGLIINIGDFLQVNPTYMFHLK